ncbi:Piso0_005819 [Millerozyma farinosa CBS 7064]|uniref:Piso0_005819 protein n=1 Tax=Pichia sorbitophila (strain ATCC MYA-4447 / BCRC 22081 / CBS 7064 / NBRC 10061 / NRRL Y-12695) TaxID=559304 RepID=G8Y303_PICSO|nr:Piso0_005819 [Millerozyma farinosa CBS 7064]
MDSDEDMTQEQPRGQTYGSFSSPVRPRDVAEEGIVDKIHAKQRQRANRLYHPLSSPIRPSGQADKRRGPHEHEADNENRVVINSRNKHERIREIRERQRQQRVLWNREHASESQQRGDLLRRYDTEASRLDPAESLDALLSYEREDLEQHNSSSKPSDADPGRTSPCSLPDNEHDRYQCELESYLADEVADIDALVGDLDLSDN